MERFAKIKHVGRRRKLDITAICRCCGLENSEKENIFEQISDDGVDFSEKVSILTGISLSITDKMPQSMCFMCIDKINDFYEFRLMSLNTEKQTREALGLPEYVAAATVKETKPSPLHLKKLKFQPDESSDNLLIERTLQEKKETIPSTSKKRQQTQTQQPPNKKSKKDVSCGICKDAYFGYQDDLNDHLIKDHLPLVVKYACGSCRETFKQLSDHKAHENMHSKEKLPYTCFLCSTQFIKRQDYNRHMTNYNCNKKPQPEKTVEDIKCFQCKKKFLTQNLFEWHACFLKTRGSCSKCGKYYAKKKSLFRHYVLCEGKFRAPDSACNPGNNIKSEAISKKNSVTVSKAIKGPKKKIVPTRKSSTMPNIVKKELNLDPLTGEPVEEDDYSNYQEDITYDNFGNDSDSNEAQTDAFEPVVQLQEQPSVRIKKERINDQPIVQQKSILMQNQQNSINVQLIRQIKKEKGLSKTFDTLQQKNTWKLKIKAERGASGQSAAQVLNPMALKKTQEIAKSHPFPKGLAMKIKMEKKDPGYGDDMIERDEAEPEDEDLLGGVALNQQFVKVKQEKMDPAYGDVTKVMKKKQLINPMAMLLMRDKTASNGLPEKSLVISAVTSINSVSPSEEGNSTKQSTVETSVGPQREEENDVTKARGNLVMVQIPREIYEHHENYSSTRADQNNGVSNASKNLQPFVPSETETRNEDELNALLKIYEDKPQATDSSDLFQELLKSD